MKLSKKSTTAIFRNTKCKKGLTPKEKFEKMIKKWKKQVNDKEYDLQKRNNRKRKIKSRLVCKFLSYQ